jgi:AbrB family looped-hinge helix DNA binding protein
MESIKASSKGQMIIPKQIRQALDIRSGTQLLVELDPGKGFKVTLKPGDHAAQARRLAGCLARYAKGRASVQTDDSAMLRAVAEDDARIRAYAKRKPR